MKFDPLTAFLVVVLIAAEIGLLGFLTVSFFVANFSKLTNDSASLFAGSGNIGMASGARLIKVSRALADVMDALEKFPYSHRRNGKPLLSWRVALLPFMGHEELFRKFNLEEPWDSDHNRKLLSEIPEEFLYADLDDQTLTRIAMPSGRSMFWNPNSDFTYDRCRDGLKHSVLFYETSKPIPWTKPTEPLIESDNPHKSIYWHSNELGYVATASHEQKRIGEKMSKDDLTSVLTANGGEVVSAKTWK